uniref:Uncharacterized protein n=1 Tax=Timema cristinae TaxID=61476 RepID=A0A7R9HD28_TIMCR|nr:unnamed protein product [Timema cristinae]
MISEQDAVRAIDIYDLFLLDDGAINLDLFERFIGAPNNKKIDNVHWNRRGIKLVELHLKSII